jgi:predicted alpha/beta hydrolase
VASAGRVVTDSARLPAQHEKLRIDATDGYPLAATLFGTDDACAMIIINCATGAPARYYERYARFLTEHRLAALTWDYRGTAASRPSRMRGFEGSFAHWGARDFAGVLAWAQQRFANRPIDVVGHSVGGVVPGLAANNAIIRRLLTVGAQLAYWPDYQSSQRLQMRLLWHGVAPVVTRLCGYFPGRALRLGEDLPAGVIADWNETTVKASVMTRAFREQPLPDTYAAFATLFAETLSFSSTDDAFATEPAVARLSALMRGTTPEFRRVAPHTVGAAAIGHFGFFRTEFRNTLWRDSVAWLTRTPDAAPI